MTLASLDYVSDPDLCGLPVVLVCYLYALVERGEATWPTV
jgi:hypothetical protein